MWVAGYSFLLLNNLFTSHWGFQKSSSRPSYRRTQTEINKGNFAKFRKEVKTGDFIGFKLYSLYTADISPLQYIQRE